MLEHWMRVAMIGKNAPVVKGNTFIEAEDRVCRFFTSIRVDTKHINYATELVPHRHGCKVSHVGVLDGSPTRWTLGYKTTKSTVQANKRTRMCSS